MYGFLMIAVLAAGLPSAAPGIMSQLARALSSPGAAAAEWAAVAAEMLLRRRRHGGRRRHGRNGRLEWRNRTSTSVSAARPRSTAAEHRMRSAAHHSDARIGQMAEFSSTQCPTTDARKREADQTRGTRCPAPPRSNPNRKVRRRGVGGIFISYRRGDLEGQARALSIELANYTDANSIFMDVDSIALGRDFRQSLQESLKSCEAVLALIGPGWLDARDAAGRRRFEDPDDYVRQEIAVALKQKHSRSRRCSCRGLRCRPPSDCRTI